MKTTLVVLLFRFIFSKVVMRITFISRRHHLPSRQRVISLEIVSRIMPVRVNTVDRLHDCRIAFNRRSFARKKRPLPALHPTHAGLSSRLTISGRKSWTKFTKSSPSKTPRETRRSVLLFHFRSRRSIDEVSRENSRLSACVACF